MHLDNDESLVYPLWADPTFRVDPHADVILDGQSTINFFGRSVASAGDFNGDGLDDVIVGASGDDNNEQARSGSAFIFFGQSPVGQLILRADADADITLDGQNGGDELGWSVASAGDFNGDGLKDIIVGAHEDDNNGETDSGSAFIFFSPVSAPTVFNDFDADSNSDLLILNTAINRLVVGRVDVGVVQSINTVSTALSTVIHSGTGDFNGDRKADFLYYDTATGNVSVSLFDGTSILAGGNLVTLPLASGLKPKGIGDIDGDGKSDVLLFDETSGEVVGLLVDGTTITGAGAITTVAVGADWTFLNTGDFDGNGTTDLFLYNTVSGSMAYVPLNGLTPSPQVGFFSLDPAAGWVIEDTGDFNGDGKADLLVLNTIDGTVVVVLLDGTTLISGVLVHTIDVANGWTLVNAGDYDRDGKLDVLMFNTVTGVVHTLLLDGTTPLGVQPLIQLGLDYDWTIHSGKP